MTDPRCSIIIRCCNEERHIGRLLTGILQQTVENREIIVVDSGSTDATTAIASRFPVRIVSIDPGEFSFGRSLNRGCTAARGEFLVLASAHVYPVYRDWLERLLEPFADPNVALTYGKQRGAAATRYSEHRVFAKWFSETSNPRQDHPFCNNANAAVRRAAWQELRYSESLTGLEDIDWAKRAIARGLGIAYAAEAEVIHVHDETASGIYNRYRREAIAFHNIFPESRFTFADFLKLFAANAVADARHAAHERVLWRSLSGILMFRAAQFWGTFRGYAQKGVLSERLKRAFYYPGEKTRSRGGRPGPADSHRVDYSNVTEGEVVERDY